MLKYFGELAVLGITMSILTIPTGVLNKIKLKRKLSIFTNFQKGDYK